MDTFPRQLSEFTVSERTFFVTGRELRVSRWWSRSIFESEVKHDFSVSVRGVAIADNDICVIGTNHRSGQFDLTIRSDLNVKQSWVQIKRLSLLAYGDKYPDSPERRIRDLSWTPKMRQLAKVEPCP